MEGFKMFQHVKFFSSKSSNVSLISKEIKLRKVTPLPSNYVTPKANLQANIDILPVVGSEQPLQLPKNTPPLQTNEVLPVSAMNGVPTVVSDRRVHIYKQPKNAMQSGKQNATKWRIDFNTQDRWENRLIGWASSADTQQGLKVTFDTKEEAVRFAERHGYEYTVHEEQAAKFVKKLYADNFKPITGKLRLIRTK